MRDADVLNVGSTSLIGRLIRRFTGGKYNHTAMMLRLHAGRYAYLKNIRRVELPKAWIGRWCVVEADWRVQVKLWDDYVQRNANLALGSYGPFIEAQRLDIIDEALNEVGGGYSFRLLLRHGIDKLMGTNLKNGMDPDDKICSKLVGMSYGKAGYYKWNDKSAHEANPTDMWIEQQKPGWDVYWRKDIA